jgi:hypothetical protein
LVLSAAGLAVGALVGGGVAVAAFPQPAIQTKTPRSEKDVANIDIVRQQIKNYYGDPLGTGVFNPDGNYAKEARAIAEQAGEYLISSRRTVKTRAIVLDVDDTTLNTWNYKLSVNFASIPASLDGYVKEQ